MIVWLATAGIALLCLGGGFFFGTAYGVAQEQRANAERQRTLRALKRVGQ